MVNEKTTTFGLSAETLIELLGIGAEIEPAAQTDDTSRAEQLEMMLDSKLPIEPSLLKSVPEFIRQNKEVTDFLAGNTIGQMLVDSQTDIYLVRKIKEYGKKRSTSEIKPHQRDAAIVIYYAAIANALVYHEVRITASGHEDLDSGLALLLEKAWLDSALAELFKKARQVCQEFLDKQKHRKKTP